MVDVIQSTRGEACTAPSDVRDSESSASECLDGTAAASLTKVLTEQKLADDIVAEFVFGAPEGSVLALGGVETERVRIFLNQIDPDCGGRRVLFTRIGAAPSTDAIVEQFIGVLAETARRLWPVWFTDVRFEGCRNDALGQLAVGAIARRAAEQIPGLLPAWAEAAGKLALDNRPPRVAGTLAAIEVAQLALTISHDGLIVLADVGCASGKPNRDAVVHALEWIATHSRCAVVALFSELPPNEPPFDRILYGSLGVISAATAEPEIIDSVKGGDANAALWIAPWRGLPHPLSDVEQRLAKALSGDDELAPLFCFNQFVDTVRGSRPKVDLVWMAGRLVVELDGYGSHGNRAAFVYDRHRDYELALSGYTVLRLANDEVAQDTEKAIDKIRNLVRLRRTQITEEA
jgi:hypothetical protein